MSVVLAALVVFLLSAFAFGQLKPIVAGLAFLLVNSCEDAAECGGRYAQMFLAHPFLESVRFLLTNFGQGISMSKELLVWPENLPEVLHTRIAGYAARNTHTHL